MEIDITTRIELLLSEFGLAPSAFADGIQIPRAIMSHILSRRNKPSLEVVQKILKKFPQVNSDWLLNGLGDMIQLNIFDDLENATLPNQSSSNFPPTASNTFIPIATPVDEPVIIPEAISANTPISNPNISADNTLVSSFVDNKVQEKSQLESDNNIKVGIENTTIVEHASQNLKPTALPDFSKKIEKIIFFYSDKSFSVHLPE